MELSEPKKIVGFIAMALGMFVALLDVQIVSGSIHAIRGGLSASQDEMSRIQTSYLIAEIVMIPIAGWLARVFSTRWVFTASTATFTLASLLCGLAWSVESMVVFRAIQGFVGGAMIPLAFSAGFALFSGKKAILVPAVLGTLGTLAPALGPVFGGWITETSSWRYMFYINIIPGIFILITVPFLVRVDESNHKQLTSFDLFSIPFIVLALGCLGYVLEEGVKRDWFHDPTIAACTSASAAASVVVIWRGLTHPKPVLDIGALRIRNYLLSCILAFLTGVGNFGAIFLLPLFLSEVRNYNSLQIGEAIFIIGVSQLLATIVITVTSSFLDKRLLIGLGVIGYGASLFMMTPLTNEWGSSEFFWSLALRGAASIAIIIPITSLALSDLPSWRLPMASGLYNLMRNLGGAIAIAGINILLQNRQSLHYKRFSEYSTFFENNTLDLLSTLTSRFGDLFVDDAHAESAAILTLTEMAKREALVLSASDAFCVMGLLFFLSLPLVVFFTAGVTKELSKNNLNK